VIVRARVLVPRNPGVTSSAKPDPWPRKVAAASQARAQRRPSPASPTQASSLPFSLVAEALQGAARQRPRQGTPPPDQIHDQGTCCRPRSASSTSWQPPPPRRSGRTVAVPPASPLPRQPPLSIDHLLPARAAAQQCPACQTPPTRSSAGPCPTRTAMSLSSRSSPSLDPSLLRPSRLDSPSLWLDRRLPSWIHRCRGLSGRIHRYPFYSAADAATMTGADACAATDLSGGAPGCSNDRRSKKVGLLVLFCCVALPTVDARTSTPPEKQATVACLPTTATSTSTTSTSRGYRLLEIHTSLYSSRNICTLTRLRGISTRRLLSSVSTLVSSCVVPPLW
jgi:hypothetical protein